MVKCSYKKCGMNVYTDGSENLLLHLKGISEYVMPKPNEKFCMNSSTDENDSSEKGDFELTNTEEAVPLLKLPRFQNVGYKSGLFVTIHFFVWTVLSTLLLTLLYLWTKNYIFNIKNNLQLWDLHPHSEFH